MVKWQKSKYSVLEKSHALELFFQKIDEEICNHKENKVLDGNLRGLGVLDIGMVKNEFDTYQMLFTESKNIAPNQCYWLFNVENTYNNIMRTNFKCNFPEMAILKIKNLSPPTFFELEVYKLVHMI